MDIMIKQLDELIDKTASIVIQYFDTDRETILNERRYSGVVTHIDEMEGVTIKTGDTDNPFSMLPPSIEAWSRDEKKNYHAHWLVYRTQTKREDGEHEWWDWQPKV